MPVVPFRELPPLDPSLVPQRLQESYHRHTLHDRCYPPAGQESDAEEDNITPATSHLRGYCRSRNQDEDFEINAPSCSVDQTRENFHNRIYPSGHSSAPQGPPLITSSVKPTYSFGKLGSPETVTASGYPPHYGYYSPTNGGYPGYPGGSGGNGGGGERKRKRDDDDEGRAQGGGENGGGEGHEGDDEEREPPRKVPKKTPVACDFCRGRKLKCDGGRPACINCARRGVVCRYDEAPRRRGPGRKTKLMMMKKEHERLESQQPQASSSTTSLASTLYRDPAPPFSEVPDLPGPPPPSYPYPVGQIQRSSARLEARDRTEAGPSMQHPPYHVQPGGAYQAPQPQRDRPVQSYHYGRTEQLYQHQWQVTATQYSQPEHPYAREHMQAQEAGYPVHGESSSSRGVWSREREESVNRSDHGDEGDEEGTPGSRPNKRASSPPEDIA